MEDSIAPSELALLWKDNIWDRLLDSLDEQSVIPIVGSDLLTIENDGDTLTLDRYLAGRLADSNNLRADDIPDERGLNFVVCRLLRAHKDRYAICDDIFQIMKDSDLKPGEPLRKLAEIPAFNLFVTTTFAPLLERAVNETRFGGAAGTASISYSPKRVDDLPTSKDKLTRPTVYYLMGKLSATGGYVLSDEDLLEHVCDLQTPARRPERLFDELKKSHLLILGEGFSDWLARVFLRIAKGGRLSAMRESLEILADSRTQGDPGLVSFLQQFSSHTRVFRAGGAIDFVNELSRRWRERHPEAVPFDSSQATTALPPGGVFISYASEDAACAEELRSGLEAAGVTVWFDQESLRSGDNYHPRIEEYIARGCNCFVAMISQTTELRHEGYFRREWSLALERDRGIHHARRFILPVIVDDTLEPATVPRRFAELNYTWLPGGRVTPVFVRDVQGIIQNTRAP